MKKVYQKPAIMFEDFSLSVNVASDCEGVPVGNPSRGTCGIITSSGDIIFTDGITDCEFTPVDMGGEEDQWDGFCYHVPTEYNNLFNS